MGAGPLQFPRRHGHRLSPSVLSGGREPQILRITLHRKKQGQAFTLKAGRETKVVMDSTAVTLAARRWRWQ